MFELQEILAQILFFILGPAVFAILVHDVLKKL